MPHLRPFIHVLRSTHWCSTFTCAALHCSDTELRKPEEDPLWLHQQLQDEAASGALAGCCHAPHAGHRYFAKVIVPHMSSQPLFANSRRASLRHAMHADQLAQSHAQAMAGFSAILGQASSGGAPPTAAQGMEVRRLHACYCISRAGVRRTQLKPWGDSANPTP